MHASHIASVIAVGAISLPLVADTASAVAASPWTTPSIGTQLAELKGYDTVAGDNFGSSVAISGTTLVVGSYAHANNAGRVYVFTRTSRAWKQVAELKGYDTVAGDSFGGSVATSGATVVVGAEALDRAYVFTRTPTGWKQTAELKGSHSVGSTLTNTGDEFGTSVAISGTTIVVSAPVHANYAGRAYVFTKTAAGWKQVAELKGANTISGDQFGTAVAISGRTAVVGAYQAAGGAGRAYVFTKTAASWKQVAELKGSDTVSNDDFGASVAVSGTTVVVGALGHATVRRSDLRVHRNGSRLGTSGRPEGLQHRRQRHLRLLGGDLRHDPRRGSSWRCWRCRPGLCVQQVNRRLEASGRAEGLRHRHQRRLRVLGGDLGHDGLRRRSGPRRLRRPGLRVRGLTAASQNTWRSDSPQFSTNISSWPEASGAYVPHGRPGHSGSVVPDTSGGHRDSDRPRPGHGPGPPAPISARGRRLPEMSVKIAEVAQVATPLRGLGGSHQLAAGSRGLLQQLTTSARESTMHWSELPREPEPSPPANGVPRCSRVAEPQQWNANSVGR